MAKRSKKKKFSIFGFSLGLLLLLITIIFIYILQLIGVVPNKYLYIGGIGLIILSLIIQLILSIKKRKKIWKIFKGFNYLLAIILIAGYAACVYYLNKTLNFFDNISIMHEEVTNYYVTTLSNTRYQEVSDIYGLKLGYFSMTDEKVLSSLKLDLEETETNDINELKDMLLNNQVDAILITDIIKNRYEEEDPEFNDKIKILKTIEIANEIEDITKKVSIKNTPFSVLISGIDTYGDINTTSRNDVNIVATINPNTNEILLTSIPRDYYVQLHDKPGRKDKLTHASYYGQNCAIQTIEDIFNIDINYYVKVNFSTVVDLVNSLGGIDIYADQYINVNGCTFKKGMNYNVKGACTLVFSRERYSYSDGDRHRGRNQQEVIKSVFSKVTSGNILNNYSSLLKSMDGKFATNMEIDELLNYIKYELDDINNYEIYSYQVDGYGSMGETYSYPGQDLWIMIPYENTINKGKDLINKMLNNESIKEDLN